MDSSTRGFKISPYKNSLTMDYTDTEYPSQLWCHNGDTSVSENKASTNFGYVIDGSATIKTNGQNYPITKEHYFSIPGAIEISGSGRVVMFNRIGYHGVFTFGGPIEDHGRLEYIDGCETSILIHAPRLGDPGLHHLLFPANILQSMHTHPSIRLGVVIKGSGLCVLDDKKIELHVGDVFCIEKNSRHSFESGPKGLEVISYHPDSNVGPTDETHPMRSATYVLK